MLEVPPVKGTASTVNGTLPTRLVERPSAARVYWLPGVSAPTADLTVKIPEMVPMALAVKVCSVPGTDVPARPLPLYCRVTSTVSPGPNPDPLITVVLPIGAAVAEALRVTGVAAITVRLQIRCC